MGQSDLKIGAVVQARMGSSRLPGKVLRPIAGRPLLDHVVGRLVMLRNTVTVVVATSTEPRDDVVARIARNLMCHVSAATSMMFSTGTFPAPRDMRSIT
jgi:spore coat polysaccharide biosynthesis protein SpsF (cytidylyltransferase family)